MNEYYRWLYGADRCGCSNGYAKIADCDCEAILLRLTNAENDIIAISGDTDLSDYYTKAEVDALIPSLSGYATEEWVLNKNYLTDADLSDYATEEWVLNKHYLTNADMSDYALKSEIPVVPTNVSSFINDAGYLTEHTPLKTINGQTISGSGNIVIEGSGTSVTVDENLDPTSTNPVENKTIVEALNGLNESKLDASAYTPTDLSNYYNKQEVNNLIPTSNSGLTNDAHYITSGDSVFNNYATTANTYTKTEVNNKFWCGTQQEYDTLVNKENGVLYLIYE